MTDVDSTIRVRVIGDTKQLAGELGKADTAVGRTNAHIGKLAAAAGGAAIAAGLVDFGATALEEADRLGDATTRIELQLGDLSEQLIETADDVSDLGLSTQDVLELEASFADAATAVGLTDDAIVDLADDAAATAGALALITDLEADTAIDLIGKAAGGSIKAMKELGIEIDEDAVAARALADTGKPTVDALTDSELAAARYKEVLEKLKPRLDEVRDGQKDVEASSAEVQAKFETLTGKIGEGLDGPLAALLQWTLEGVEGWELFGQAMEDQGPRIAETYEGIQGLIDAFAILFPLFGFLPKSSDFPRVPSGRPGEGAGGGSGGVTLNVTPRDSADTERAVIAALHDYDARNGSGR